MTSATRTTGTLTAAEVSSQPEVWARVLAQAPALTAALPVPGEKVLFVGCGTSYYVGSSYAQLRNAAGLGRTRAAIPSEIDYVDDDEVVVVLSRSGTTGDVIDLAERLRATHRVVGLLGDVATPLAPACHEVVDLGFADEHSVVQTRFATSALLLLRSSLQPDATDLADLADLPDQARAALLAPLPSPLPDHVVFLGTGWTVGIAHEAALKCREAAGAWTEAYPVREYQHGPIACAGPSSLVWSFAPLEEEVRGPIEATGATVVETDLDPLASLVSVHGLALALAERAGRDPDHPRHLSRSVTAR